MEAAAHASEAQERRSVIETAINSFIDLLSNAKPQLPASTKPQRPPPNQQTTSASLQSDMQRSFPAMFQKKPYKAKRPFPAPSVFTHATRQLELSFCLLPYTTSKTPRNESKLLQAGLGRRSVSMAENADHEQICRALHEEYPKMKALSGGWLLYKAAGGGGQRKLTIVAQGTEGYTGKLLKMTTNNGKIMLYIVPLQEQLDTAPLSLDAVEFKKMPKSECKKCGLTMPLQLLIGHIEDCGQETDTEQVDEDHQVQQNEPDVIFTGIQDQPTCPVCGDQYPPDVLLLHASSCGESGPEEMPSTSSAVRVSEHREEGIPVFLTQTFEEPWKRVHSPHAASTLFKRNILREKQNAPPIRASIDIREDQTCQTRDIIAFYKNPQIDWARPFQCSLQGDIAVGTGVQRHFFSLVMLKLQHGFNIHSGMANITLLFEGQEDHLLPSTSQILVDSDFFVVAGRMIGHSFLNDGPKLHGLSEAIVHMLLHDNTDTVTLHLDDVADIRETIGMLDGDEPLSDQKTHEINNLGFAWDLPPVITRTARQVKQIRKGLKDTKVWTLLKERTDTAGIIFPRHADSILTAQDILSQVVWPGDDSDNDDDHPFPKIIQDQTVGFLRTFIEQATPSHLSQLMKFWVGWEIPASNMTVKVVQAEYLTSSTCFLSLRVPGHFKNYEDFSSHVVSCIATCITGFGLL